MHPLGRQAHAMRLGGAFCCSSWSLSFCNLTWVPSPMTLCGPNACVRFIQCKECNTRAGNDFKAFKIRLHAEPSACSCAWAPCQAARGFLKPGCRRPDYAACRASVFSLAPNSLMSSSLSLGMR